MAAHIDVHMTGGADQPVEVATLQLLSLELAIRVNLRGGAATAMLRVQ
jgi:hypothetical protein